ncbi:MAG: hypothetical protein QOF94_2732 [Acidobacteriaceae bacterium]|jgi:hypothetical protein
MVLMLQMKDMVNDIASRRDGRTLLAVSQVKSEDPNLT